VRAAKGFRDDVIGGTRKIRKKARKMGRRSSGSRLEEGTANSKKNGGCGKSAQHKSPPRSRGKHSSRGTPEARSVSARRKLLGTHAEKEGKREEMDGSVKIDSKIGERKGERRVRDRGKIHGKIEGSKNREEGGGGNTREEDVNVENH